MINLYAYAISIICGNLLIAMSKYSVIDILYGMLWVVLLAVILYKIAGFLRSSSTNTLTTFEFDDESFDLVLNRSNIETLNPEFFKNRSSVTYLDLSCNRITEIPSGIFDDMINLEKINLSRNNLRTLPPFLFSKLPKLKRIDLSFNHFTSLPDIPDIKCELSNQTPYVEIVQQQEIERELADDVSCYISHDHILIGSKFRMCENPVPHFFLNDSWNAWENQSASNQCVVCRSYQVSPIVYKRIPGVSQPHDEPLRDHIGNNGDIEM